MNDFSLNNFNMDDYGQGFETFLFPPDSYRAIVTRVATEKFDTNGWVGINWVVTGGQYKGKEFFQFLQLNNNPDRDTSDASIKFGRDMLANTFRATGFATPPSDWEELVGHGAILHLDINKYKGRESSNLAHIEKDPLAKAPGNPGSSVSSSDDEDFDDAVPF